ncbi:thiolase-like protein [Aspergillus violaceofuscus CBS 115571]|uniref:Thiolase-like protein n=1 Tax=Aspergillus violaceofuscus (strain CBS 115571) TaxID=1450538 RepID=A0A2V5HLL3_ASPV1|nr:thiolase-like protein [Aspergillus violaceofuscus CBS 115571]
MNKRDARGEVPRTRYDINGYYDPARPHASKTRYGYFLNEDPALFDAHFFSITHQEASRMDPQQRLLLEVVWECLENAGETDWEGKEIGCFVGTFGEDWLGLAYKDHQHSSRYQVLGTGDFALSNSTSNQFDFRGPRQALYPHMLYDCPNVSHSMTIQTACSSSLVAIHEASQALYTGSCSAAIVAGTSLILSPTITTNMSDSMVLSPNGSCRTFDANADGFARGEGINALYLKRLEDALRCKDPIRAIIRSTSANSDGRSAILTTPSAVSQECLIRSAYRRAGIVDVASTGYFECHGTGTMAGDTAELSALCQVLGGKGAIIGVQVKPNFGHAEGAAGITSMIKAILSLEHGTISPNMHFECPNPHIDLDAEHIQVPVEAVEWPRDRRLRVSVNGFGVGGANAHVILESAGTQLRPDASPLLDSSPRLLVVSAHDEESLQKRIEQVVAYVCAHPNRFTDLAFTLARRRKHLAHRGFAVIHPDREVDKLDFTCTHSRPSTSIAFVLTGQGAHWLGMGRDLLYRFPAFRRDIRELDKVLQSSFSQPPDWCLEDLFKACEPHQMGRPDMSQPLCTALQIGLVNLFKSWDTMVVGHSSGEIAAAYAAGAISASSAILLAYLRRQAILSVPKDSRGDMVSVGLGRNEVIPYLVDGVQVACDNSPQNVTLAGPCSKIDRIAGALRESTPDTFCRRLRLNVAYHSAAMKSVGPEYENSVAGCLKLNAKMLPMFSILTTEAITTPSTLDAAYWRANLESPVQFLGAVRNLLDASDTNLILIEVGPHAALSGPLKQIFHGQKTKSSPCYIPTLTRDDPSCEQRLFSVVGGVFSRGGAVSLGKVIPHGLVLSDLAPYPLQHRERYWSESRLSRDWRLCSDYHELLGYPCTEVTDAAPTWRNVLHLDSVPWLADHVIQGQVVFPATGYISMAGEAVRQLSGEALASYDGNAWTKHCTGLVRHHVQGAGLLKRGERSVTPLIRHVSTSRWYQSMVNHGMVYGTPFRGLRHITADPCGERAVGNVSRVVQPGGSQYQIHPTVIDQCMQLLGIANTAGLTRRLDRGYVPASLGRVFVDYAPSDLTVEASITSKASHLRGDVIAMDHKRTILSIEGGVFVALDDSHQFHSNLVPLIAHLEWRPDTNLEPPYNLFCALEFVEVYVKSVRRDDQYDFLCLLERAYKNQDIKPCDDNLWERKDCIRSQIKTRYM